MRIKFVKNTSIKHIFSILTILLMILISFQDVNAEPKKYRLGDIPLSDEMYQKHLKKIPRDMITTLETALPPSYDARDLNLVTPAKNQGSCGSCWAFASVGALESHLIKSSLASAKDLSEQQQVSCNTSMWGCSGGSATAIIYWEVKGPEYETDFPYTKTDQTPCMEEVLLGYRVKDFHTVQTTTTGFKESLYTDGPSYWRFTVYNDFYTFWGSYNPGAVYVNNSSSYVGGHAVLLIGWDDAKGAFLCKNSWGTGGPNGDGTFWIAYEGHLNNLGFGMANFSVLSTVCGSDSDCDDGIYCNGTETCSNGTCQDGSPVVCNGDGYFCNGDEYCDEIAKGCISTGDPCGYGYNCEEDNDLCVPDTCYNGICEEGEDCTNCSDCISGSGGGDCTSCFKGVCDGNCHPVKEGPDCSDCAPAYCCGDGVCNGSENSENCGIDCGDMPITVTESDCADGVDNDGDNLTDCDDPDCTGSPYCGVSCFSKKKPCTSDSECCSYKCVKGICR